MFQRTPRQCERRSPQFLRGLISLAIVSFGSLASVEAKLSLGSLDRGDHIFIAARKPPNRVERTNARRSPSTWTDRPSLHGRVPPSATCRNDSRER